MANLDGPYDVPCGSAHCEEPVRGVVVIDVPPGRSLDHLGIKVEMIGQIGAWLGG